MTKTHIKNRSALLDCIRSVAILLVIIYHAIEVYGIADVGPFTLFLSNAGPYGVDIFFALSGYLIARYLLVSSGGNAIRTFFLRRIFRILPLYLVAVTAFLVAMVLLNYDAHLVDRIWIPYLFLTAWFVGIDGAATVPYTITWTLSVEEFSYISFGIMALISRRFFPAFLIFCLVGASLLRWYMAAESLPGYWYLPITRIDSIAVGGLVAWVLMHRTPLQTVLGLAAVIGAMVVASGFDPALAKSLRMNYVPYTTCIVIVIFDTWMRGVSNRGLEAVGSIGFYSYFLYLIHYFNIHALDILLPKLGIPLPSLWVFVLIVTVLTYVQAVISYRFFEAPMIRYGRTFEIPNQTAKTSVRATS